MAEAKIYSVDGIDTKDHSVSGEWEWTEGGVKVGTGATFTLDGHELKATTGVTGDTNIVATRSWVDKQISDAHTKIVEFKGTVSFTELSALTSAKVGDLYNVTQEGGFNIGSHHYDSGTNLVCKEAFTGGPKSPLSKYWDAYGSATVDLSGIESRLDEVETNIDGMAGEIGGIDSRVQDIEDNYVTSSEAYLKGDDANISEDWTWTGGSLEVKSTSEFILDGVSLSATEDDSTAETEENYIATRNWTRATIKASQTEVVSFKGSRTWAQIKAISKAKVGDLYNVSDEFALGGKTYEAGTNVVCIAEITQAIPSTALSLYWDTYGSSKVDLSNYYDKTTIDTKLNGKISKTDLTYDTDSGVYTLNY